MGTIIIICWTGITKSKESNEELGINIIKMHYFHFSVNSWNSLQNKFIWILSKSLLAFWGVRKLWYNFWSNILSFVYHKCHAHFLGLEFLLHVLNRWIILLNLLISYSLVTLFLSPIVWPKNSCLDSNNDPLLSDSNHVYLN